MWKVQGDLQDLMETLKSIDSNAPSSNTMVQVFEDREVGLLESQRIRSCSYKQILVRHVFLLPLKPSLTTLYTKVFPKVVMEYQRQGIMSGT